MSNSIIPMESQNVAEESRPGDDEHSRLYEQFKGESPVYRDMEEQNAQMVAKGSTGAMWELYNLTRLWVIAGKPPGKAPREWIDAMGPTSSCRNEDMAAVDCGEAGIGVKAWSVFSSYGAHLDPRVQDYGDRLFDVPSSLPIDWSQAKQIEIATTPEEMEALRALIEWGRRDDDGDDGDIRQPGDD